MESVIPEASRPQALSVPVRWHDFRSGPRALRHSVRPRNSMQTSHSTEVVEITRQVMKMAGNVISRITPTPFPTFRITEG